MSQALTKQRMSVDTCGDGAAALQQLGREPYDVLLLDVMMPGTSGVDLLPSVFKVRPGLKVMMLSALNEPRLRVKCLELGAVDYVAKPFVLAELVARVRVHARNGNGNGNGHVNVNGNGNGNGTGVRTERRAAERRVGGGRRVIDRRKSQPYDVPEGEDNRFVRRAGATLDLHARRVHVGGAAIALSERESLVLAHLMRRAGDVCTRTDILREVWGTHSSQSSNVVDVYVARLRVKLPAGSIATVRNTGYAYSAA